MSNHNFDSKKGKYKWSSLTEPIESKQSNRRCTRWTDVAARRPYRTPASVEPVHEAAHACQA